jgi:hypothetical protein
MKNILCKSEITNMAIMQNFEVILDKFNVHRICPLVISSS